MMLFEKVSFTSFFLILMTLFSCLIAVAETASTMLNRSGTWTSWLCVGTYHIKYRFSLSDWGDFFFYPNFQSFEQEWVFVSTFPVSVEMITFLLLFLLKIRYGD